MGDAPRRRKHDLAVPASRFIGRAAELRALGELFAGGSRLVTLWGTAGMGKTRVSIEFALGWADAYAEHAVCFCEVEEARDLGAFCGVVSRAVGAPVAAGKKDAGTVDRIGRTLAAQGPMLLVLDNLEQVIHEAAPALDRWVRAAPEVRFLVTSRERSRLPGEVSYELSPLSLPDEHRVEQGSEAVDLFLDRVNAQRPRNALGAESVPKIATLVRRLEGIPLAIELAAARADVLGLDGLVRRLESRLDLLAGGRRGVEARQATLRSAIEWSWDLLDETERRALVRCSVFRGGFTLAAADAVLGEPGRAALDDIQSLRDKSLLRAVPRGAEVRFSLYEGVREFAAEMLAERGEGQLAGERHSAHYLAEGEAAADAWRRTGGTEPLDRLAGELGNLLGVVERSLAPPVSRASAERAQRALLAIDPVLTTRGPFGTHLELLDRALAAAEASGADRLLVVRALAARGRARHLRGQGASGREDLERARAQAAAIGAQEAEAEILTEIGVLHHQRREMAEARTHYEEALALHRRSGDRRAEGRALGNLGAVHHDERSFDEAMRKYEAALAIAAEVGDRRAEGIFSTNVGLLEQERGSAAPARRRYERAIAVLEDVGDLRLLAITLGNLALLHHEEGRLEEARSCYARASSLLREVGDRRSEALAEGRLGAALASLDRTEDARLALSRGERLMVHVDDPLGAELLALTRGFLDLALSRSARIEGRAGEADQYLAEARRRIDHARGGAPSLADRSDDIRLCLRILERSLSAMDDRASPAAAELLIAPDARWCRPPGGAWQDLRERHAVRRLLVRLVERRRETPGRGVPLAELQEAGWPGERILPDAASNRIYVAVNQLRKLGLKDWLRRSGEGYFLDAALPVHHVSVEPV